ncbi:DUF4422 domain-containing protein [Flavobacterium granuli]|uniref:Uncharacterized protein DUF4422 n=1 Tax=Flavobacterium granuli TaxID=280093 RepID=A0A1M5LMK8_9FLAO|nr:DUF4422 domain-containing protein [Flavobacterium granuli]PRZ24016.1 uncharacterized protein DUF4422 [Flavobacterium granuli]SHG65553.1 protein of unknown function [Flavobacterium granuli]
MNTKILICTHKNFNYIPNESFLPIHVGKEISQFNLPYQADNIGINISSKNKNYCELTALYWAWKNLNFVDTIGLCHYRRFFDFSESKKSKKITEITEDYFSSNFQNYIFKQHFLDKCDIILPNQLVKTRSLYSHYSLSHLPQDFEILTHTLNELYPEYMDSFKTIMIKNNAFSPFNMFIAKKELVADYSTWLFSILEKVEQQIEISKNPYQERVLGFMSERLLNVYIHHNQLKVKYLPVHFVSDKNKSKTILMKKLAVYNNNIIFWFRSKFPNKTIKNK